MAINTYLSIIILNVNGKNASIKTHSSRMDKKIRPIYMQCTGVQTQIKRHTQTESKRIEKKFYTNGNKQTNKQK